MFDGIALDDLIPLVNWDMLSVGWKVPVHSSEAKRLIDDAKSLLEIPRYRTVLADGIRSIGGLFAAGSDGLSVTLALPDDAVPGRFRPVGELYFFRRQTVLDGGSSLSLADYVLPPVSDGKYQDAVGLFVVTAGIGLTSVVEELRDEGDGYRAILLQMVADRLAEACAEATNSRIESWWGLSGSGLGTIRPAPDIQHGLIIRRNVRYSVLDATAKIGVELTDRFAMSPAASVCGSVMAGKDLRYFSVGAIGADQMSVYARRKNCDPDNLASVIQGME